MAKQSVNKSQLIKEYLKKHPDKKTGEIAALIGQEQGVNVSSGFVSAVKSDLKKSKGGKKAKAKTTAAPAPAKSAQTRGDASVSQHVANLKAAALRLGKDEAKRIIDLL